MSDKNFPTEKKFIQLGNSEQKMAATLAKQKLT